MKYHPGDYRGIIFPIFFKKYTPYVQDCIPCMYRVFVPKKGCWTYFQRNILVCLNIYNKNLKETVAIYTVAQYPKPQ